MKQLQKGFTTPEQSKRLLELGVPADSADFRYCCEINYETLKYFNEDYPTYKYWDDENDGDIPCWSVGRLIEILYISDKLKMDIFLKDITPVKNTMIENLIEIIENAVKSNDLDFSKLED